MYNRVTPAIVAELTGIAGAGRVIYNDSERMEAYSRDEIPGNHYRAMPEAVVFPGSSAEIAAIVKLANRELIPLTPRGAGSGLSGGAVPIYGGIVVCTDRLNKIIEFDPANMMITVESGVIANDINEYLKDSGLFYAGYPMSMETCFIGGNVAENAGGGKAVKYGVTSRYVLGLEVVLPSGEIVQLGGKLLKDVTGYNLIPLMAGSEGTLGIFTNVTLKLIPRPICQADILALFPDSETAIAAVPGLQTESGVLPTSIEFMDQSAFTEACNYINETLPLDQCGAMLLITFDGMHEDDVTRDYEQAGRFCQRAGAVEVYVADNPATSERLWKIRRSVPEAFSASTPLQSGEDIVVPPASIPAVVKACREIGSRYGVRVPCYGHAGDGNLHARVTPPPEWDEAQWDATLPAVLQDLYAIVMELGGRISGEHGIGFKRKADMAKTVPREFLTLLQSVKQALDPNNIMNPGKIFDLSTPEKG
ncbi:MAG: FAD-binding oxidoreductase [Lentisphaerae bacterium]|nr:FAD-binding oxidoreductase [Lentisphaerota bacterium]